MEKISHRAVIQFLAKKGLTPKAIHDDMVATLGEDAPSYSMVKKWTGDFKRGRKSLEDDPRSGRPTTSTTPELVDSVRDLLRSDRRVTVRYISSVVGISCERVHHIITEVLAMRKVSAGWVPKVLTMDQKHTRAVTCSDNLNRFQGDPANFLARFVTVGETWVHHFQPETKKQSKQWKHTTSPPPKIAKTIPSDGKVRASIFWDSEGVLLVDYLQKGDTVSGAYYADLVRRLHHKIKEKRHEKLHQGVLFHQDNTLAHKSSDATAALHECGFEILDHPSFSPDLAPSDFHLFPSLKKHLAGSQFLTDEDVITAVDAFLDAQDKIFFTIGINALLHRWQKCIDFNGDYV
ncbi:histone-lysine N-methyltransferase SETMAR-like isoform 1-T2 [Discoglossus pictus]